MTIRMKKLGVLMRDARLAAGKSLEDCARLLGVTPEAYRAYELGERAPALPELELLGRSLKVPVEHFWGNTLRSSAGEGPVEPGRLLGLRQRIIGAQLRMARAGQGLAPEAVAQEAGIPVEDLKRYELGEAPVPLPVLESLAACLGRAIQEFQDGRSPSGERPEPVKAGEELKNLPPDLQAFISRPVNRPYLELAQRLSEMPAEKLRAIAESLLDITL
jgi:transcriptional regulator with XRE-family HTH domain